MGDLDIDRFPEYSEIPHHRNGRMDSLKSDRIEHDGPDVSPGKQGEDEREVP